MGESEVEGLNKKKSPDASWGILTKKRGKIWPTIVVEVGWCESTPKRRRDCLFWLQVSKQVVKVVLSFKITSSGTIKIQRWWLRPGPVRAEPGQEMTIVRDKLTGQHLISGSLEIPFEDIYLRPKNPSENEVDFSLTEDDMRDIADHVWFELDQHMSRQPMETTGP